MKKQNIRFRLTLTTSTIILSFLLICMCLFYVFLTYFAQIIERVYGIDDDILQPFFHIIFIAFVLLMVFACIASILGGFFVSEKYIKSIVQFTNQIKVMKKEGIDKRIVITHNDELDELKKEFNYLMDNIEDSIQKQNQFVSDASHELKTPLAILNGNLEMLERWGKQDSKVLDESLKVMQLEVKRMITLSSQLLQLTKEFDEKDIPFIQVDPLIERILHEYEKLYPDFTFHFISNSNKALPLRSEHFEQAVLILLDNAIKYCREDSKRIEVYHYPNMLSVKDYGIGIDEDKTTKIFDRLYRIDESRENTKNSFGLGLSILKRISEWYKFTIEVRSEKGQYTEFRLRFNGGEDDEKI